MRRSICLRLLALAGALAALSAPASAQQAASGASLRVLQPTVRAVDGIPVMVNSQALSSSSNLRLAVMPANAPEAITDATAFALSSVPIQADFLRITLPGGPAGQDEVRLYHIPQFQTRFVVAARAPVTVQPGVSGAVLSRDLVREAEQLGPLAFEAKYKGHPILIQAQFIKAIPQSEWNINWIGEVPAGEAERRLAMLSLGERGVTADAYGSTGELVCVVSVDADSVLRRVAALSPGAAVLVRGSPSQWDAAQPSDRIVINGCALAD